MRKKLFYSIVIIMTMLMLNGSTLYAEEHSWILNDILLETETVCQTGTSVTIRPSVIENIDGIKYKYVWMKNNWNEWGVLQDFSEERSCTWIPEISGEYSIYVDAVDSEGHMMTQSVTVKVVPAVYQCNGISSNIHSIQKTGSNLKISADMSGNTMGLQYKFVWMKQDWREWGVIKDFDFVSEIQWNPTKKGEYKIYVDVMDCEGKINTYTRDFVVKNYVWSFEDIQTSVDSPLEKHNMPVTIEAVTHGEEGELEYKFVWMKNNWDQWGVLKDFDSNNTIQWKAEESGDYFIYVDVRDKDGETVSERIPFTILKDGWQYDGISISPENVQLCGEEIEITPNISGYTENLRYKYVWMKDGWRNWDVIQNFTTESKMKWKLPDEPGQYTIFVDVQDDEGNLYTRSAEYWNTKSLWHITHVNVGDSQENSSPQVYTEIPLSIFTSGNSEYLKYEFVAEKLDGSQRQIIQPYSEEQNAIWYPKEAGNYKIIGCVKDSDGRVEKIEQQYSINEAAWKVEEILIDKTPIIPIGEEISVDLAVSGEAEELQYKYVWMKNNWSEWGVLKGYDKNSGVMWKPSQPGAYSLFIDVMDQRGVIFDPIVLAVNVYDYQAVGISSLDIEAGQTVNVYPDIKGACTGAEFKYVWMKNNWSEWGVIKDFSPVMSVAWTPKNSGDYSIYIDMRIEGVETCTKTKNIYVNAAYLSKINEIRNNYLYVPYRWGGASPNGWDCSGFTQWSLRYLGVNIPRTAAMQAQGGQAVNPFDMSQWKPGDIICYANNSGRVSHAALYLGNGELMHSLNNRVGTIIQGVDYYEWWDVVTHRVTVRRYL